MRTFVRTTLAVAALAAPLAIGAATSPAQATCRPEKPSTCGCPVGFERVGPVCLPTELARDLVGGAEVSLP